MITSLEEDLQAAENRTVGDSPTAQATAGPPLLPHYLSSMSDLNQGGVPCCCIDCSKCFLEESAAVWMLISGQLTVTCDCAVEGRGGDHAMLQALCSQRDRFKHKVQELQEALAGANARITAAENEKAAAKADNIALVERLRFVSSYSYVAPPHMILPHMILDSTLCSSSKTSRNACVVNTLCLKHPAKLVWWSDKAQLLAEARCVDHQVFQMQKLDELWRTSTRKSTRKN
jgi:hypothetical protein